MPVAAPQAPGVEVDIGVLFSPAGAEDVVAADRQRLGRRFRPGRRQGVQPGGSVGAEVPQCLLTDRAPGRGRQQRVAEQEGPRRQQVAGVDDVAVPLGQDGPVRRRPHRQGPAHGQGLFPQDGGNGDPVALRQKQGVERSVQQPRSGTWGSAPTGRRRAGQHGAGSRPDGRGPAPANRRGPSHSPIRNSPWDWMAPSCSAAGRGRAPRPGMPRAGPGSRRCGGKGAPARPAQTGRGRAASFRGRRPASSARQVVFSLAGVRGTRSSQSSSRETKASRIAGLAGVLPGLAQIDKDGVPVEAYVHSGSPAGTASQATGPSKWTGSQVGSISQWSRNRNVCPQISPARAIVSAAACGHCRWTAAAASAAPAQSTGLAFIHGPPFPSHIPGQSGPQGRASSRQTPAPSLPSRPRGRTPPPSRSPRPPRRCPRWRWLPPSR